MMEADLPVDPPVQFCGSAPAYALHGRSASITATVGGEWVDAASAARPCPEVYGSPYGRAWPRWLA